MERTSIARQQVSDTGLLPAYSPALRDGHAVENSGGKLVLHVRNAGEEPVVVTIRSGYEARGLRLQDREVVIAGGSSIFIGPLDPAVYNQPASSQVHIDYSQVDDVETAALLVP